MIGLISNRFALLAMLLSASLAATAPASAAAAKPASYSFKGSAVLVSASAGCSDRRYLTPGERFEFTFIPTEGTVEYLIFTWRNGFRIFVPSNKGVFRRQGPFVSLTNYGGKYALIYEGTYENFARKPSRIDAATARIELSFTTRNQDKSEACTVAWRGSGERVKHVPPEVDAMMRRLPSGRK